MSVKMIYYGLTEHEEEEIEDYIKSSKPNSMRDVYTFMQEHNEFNNCIIVAQEKSVMIQRIIGW